MLPPPALLSLCMYAALFNAFWYWPLPLAGYCKCLVNFGSMSNFLNFFSFLAGCVVIWLRWTRWLDPECMPTPFWSWPANGEIPLQIWIRSFHQQITRASERVRRTDGRVMERLYHVFRYKYVLCVTKKKMKFVSLQYLPCCNHIF